MADMIEKWEEIKVLVETIDLDLRKHAVKGNKSAGTRSRKSLRNLKRWAAELVKLSLETDKAAKAAKDQG
jgi:hypothetical protein